MLLGTLSAILLGNMLAGKGIVRAGYGPKRKGTIRVGYQNEPKFNGVYSRDNLPNKIKDGTYIISLDEHSNIGTHWIALYELNDNVIYLHIPIEIKKFIKNKDIKTNIFRIQAYDSVMCG